MLVKLLLLMSIAVFDGGTQAGSESAFPLGRWRGTASTGEQTAEVGFDITQSARGVVLRMSLPPLHAWNMPVGYLTASGTNAWVVPDWHITIARDGGALVGTLGDPRVAFRVSRVEELPAEPSRPSMAAGAEPVWRYQAGAALWAPLAAADGVVYAGDSSGRLRALRVASGKELWVFDAGAPLFGRVTPDGDSLYVMDDAAVLHKVSRRTGKSVWRVALSDRQPPARLLPAETEFEFDYASAAPVVDGGTLFISSPDGTVHAMEPQTGKVLWRHALGARVRGDAAVSSDRVFVAAWDNRAYALDRTSGRELWRFDTGAPATSTPVVGGDLVLVGSRSSWLTALRASTGEAVWSRYYWFSWVEASGVVRDGMYYVGSSDLRSVRAIEVTTGRILWETDVLGWAWGPIAVTASEIYVATAGARKYVTSHEGGVVALDRRSGKPLWRRSAPKPPDAFVSGYPGGVVLSDGLLIGANVAGVIEAYRVGR